MDIHRSMELNAFEDFPSLFNPFMGDTYTAPPAYIYGMPWSMNIYDNKKKMVVAFAKLGL